jgi:hypothetical protein
LGPPLAGDRPSPLAISESILGFSIDLDWRPGTRPISFIKGDDFVIHIGGMKESFEKTAFLAIHPRQNGYRRPSDRLSAIFYRTPSPATHLEQSRVRHATGARIRTASARTESDTCAPGGVTQHPRTCTKRRKIHPANSGAAPSQNRMVSKMARRLTLLLHRQDCYCALHKIALPTALLCKSLFMSR